MICVNCKNQIDNNTPFCPFCGSPVSSGNAGPQQVNHPNQQMNYTPQGPQMNNPQSPQMTYNPQGSQMTYNQQAANQVYNQPQYGGVNQQPQYSGNNSGQSDKKKTGLIIGIIAGSVILCTLIVVLIVVLMKPGKKDDEVASNSTSEELTAAATTEAVDKEDADSELTFEAKTEAEVTETEAATEEAKTEAAKTDEAKSEKTEEAATEAAAEVPYGQKVGLRFSDMTTKVKDKGRVAIYDSNYKRLDINPDDYLADYSYTLSVENIAVTDPDKEGNVTYVIKYKSFQEAEFTESPTKGTFYWKVGGWVYDFSDYYSGKIFSYNNLNDYEIGEIRKNQIDWKGKKVDITMSCETAVDNLENIQYNESEQKWYDSYARYTFVFITVPQDYDGLVMSVPKKYDVDYVDSLENDKTIPEDISLETKPLLDVYYYGYTEKVDDSVFIKISDYSMPYSPGLETSILSINKNPSNSDLSWFVNAIKSGKDIQHVLGEKNATAENITDPDRLAGSWTGLIIYDKTNKMGVYEEQTFRAEIGVEGNNMMLTFKYFGSTDVNGAFTNIEDRPENTMSGPMQKGSVNLAPEGEKFLITKFWTDGTRQYALGEIILQDGTEGTMVLERP